MGFRSDRQISRLQTSRRHSDNAETIVAETFSESPDEERKKKTLLDPEPYFEENVTPSRLLYCYR